MRKRRNEYKNKIIIGCEVKDCTKCKEDSIAHKIKSFFEQGYISNMIMFKYDEDTKKLKVSKKALMHCLRLCNSAELLNDYEMELVDSNDISK